MGMWEPEQPYFIHKCEKRIDGHIWSCIHTRDSKIMKLTLSIAQCCHDDEYTIEVKQCPFCGYTC